MKRKIKILLLLVLFLSMASTSHAFWIWTPETNKWVNPKYAVKETPQEQLAYALEFYNEKDYEKAIQELNKLIKNYPRAREAPEAQYYIGLSLEEQGQLYKAFKGYQMIIDKYPFSERFPEIIKRQYGIGNMLLEGKEKRNKFISAVVGSDYDLIEIFRTVIKNSPYGDYAAPAQYKIGLYLQEKQMYAEARDEFEKTINDYPSSEWAKAARYQIALSDAQRAAGPGYDQQITEVAVKEFKEFAKNYPDAELSDKAKRQINKLREKEAENNFLTAKFYEKQKNYKAAMIYYNTVIEDYKDTTFAKRALEKIREISGKMDQ